MRPDAPTAGERAERDEHARTQFVEPDLPRDRFEHEDRRARHYDLDPFAGAFPSSSRDARPSAPLGRSGDLFALDKLSGRIEAERAVSPPTRGRAEWRGRRYLRRPRRPFTGGRMSDQHERGDSRVSLYLCGVTEDEIDAICQALADIAVERGLADPEGMRAIVTAEGFEWPNEAEEMVKRLMETAAVIVIPTPDEEAVDA